MSGYVGMRSPLVAKNMARPYTELGGSYSGLREPFFSISRHFIGPIRHCVAIKWSYIALIGLFVDKERAFFALRRHRVDLGRCCVRPGDHCAGLRDLCVSLKGSWGDLRWSLVEIRGHA